jgi:hypothetical protein
MAALPRNTYAQSPPTGGSRGRDTPDRRHSAQTMNQCPLQSDPGRLSMFRPWLGEVTIEYSLGLRDELIPADESVDLPRPSTVAKSSPADGLQTSTV